MNPGLHLRLVDWPVFLVLSMLPIQWINLIDIGPLNIKPMHIGIALLGIFAATNVRQLKRGYVVLTETRWFWAPMLLYILWSAIVTFTVTTDGSLGSFARQLVYFLVWILLASRLAGLGPALRSTLYFSGIAALGFFFVAASISAAQAGVSMLDGLEALLQGNYEVFAWKFVGAIFNAYAGDEYQSLTLKNSMSGMMLVCLLAFLSAAHMRDASLLFRLFNGIIALVYAFMLPLLLSRSVLLAAGLSVFLLWLIRTRQVGMDYPIRIIMSAALLAILFLLVSGDRLLDVVYAMLLERDASFDARLGQYQAASGMIDDSPWVGRGSGLTVGDKAIHNLFLAAWAQSGIPGFLLTIGMYLGLLVAWFNMSRSALKVNVPVASSLYAPWLVALPVLPMFRVWIGGDGGNIDPSGWVALAVFFGGALALRNVPR